jgi:hypothetical protein
MNKNLWDDLELYIDLTRADLKALGGLTGHTIIEPPRFPLLIVDAGSEDNHASH